jgi:hypothetical protein
LLGSVDLSREQLPVRTPDGRKVGVVKHATDAIPILLDHYEKHPPSWEQDSATEFAKGTPWGLLSVCHEPMGLAARRRGR